MTADSGLWDRKIGRLRDAGTLGKRLAVNLVPRLQEERP